MIFKSTTLLNKIQHCCFFRQNLKWLSLWSLLQTLACNRTLNVSVASILVCTAKEAKKCCTFHYTFTDKKVHEHVMCQPPKNNHVFVSVCLSDHSPTLICGKSKTLTYQFTHNGIPALGWMCLSCLEQNMSYCLFMISHQVRGDTVCVPLWQIVCVLIFMRVSLLSTRTGKRQANQRDMVCYITEYKCPHYGWA